MNRRALLGGFVTLAAFVVLLLGWAAWRQRAADRVAPAPAADSASVGLRAVTLWFASASGDTLLSESREMLESETLHDRVAALVRALAHGSDRGGVTTLPPGTEVLNVYLDTSGLLTVDLSRPFRDAFRGGSRAEELALGALVRTLAAEVPEARRMRLVCGGSPVASLGGHLPLDRPLDPNDWP